MPNQKIYCANCLHCKFIREPYKLGYLQRVTCKKKKWIDKKGNPKRYRYDTVLYRIKASCEEYKNMGDLYPYLKELKNILPEKDKLYYV